MNSNLSIKRIFTALALACFMVGCTSESEPDNGLNEETHDITLSPATRALGESLEPAFVKYTQDVLSHNLATTENPSSFATSPLSATMLMGLIANGVDEKSRKEVTDYLGTEEINTLNEFCQTLVNELPMADPTVTIDLANSIWVNKYFGLSPNEAYLSILDTYFNGQSFNYDFDKEHTRFIKELKNWYSRNSAGLVNFPEALLRPGGATTLALLLNSLYFKAPWKIFVPEATKKGVFHGLKQPVLVDMMESYSMSQTPYYRDEYFEAFSLSFMDTAYKLYVVLPAESVSIHEAVKYLTPDFVNKIQDEMVKCTLTVSMPKFKVDSSICLNPILKCSGVGSCLSGSSFTMFESPLSSDASVNIFQNTSFAINEKGVEAASVTGGEIFISSYLPEPEAYYIVNIDRPFIFYVKEKVSKAWIASGYYAGPDVP